MSSKQWTMEELEPVRVQMIKRYPAIFAEWKPSDGMPVLIKREDGTVYAATWSGYYELGEGEAPLHSIGYWLGEAGGWSHGVLGKTDRLISSVPTLAEWKQYRAIIEGRKQG